MNQTKLDQAIIKTVSWFSIFDYPLTTFEIWKWLYKPDRVYKLGEVYKALDESVRLQELLREKDGFFTFGKEKNIEDLIVMRHDRFLDAVRKFAKLKRAATFFSLIPSVRAVATANTLSWWHTRPESDIDLFIIVKPGTIWSTRALLVLPFAILGRRPSVRDGQTNEKIDSFCFSFFMSQDNLNIESLSVAGGDPYLAFWTKSLVPILDRDAIFNKFATENLWADDKLAHASLRPMHRELKAKVFPSIPFPLRAAEGFSRSIQMKKFPERIRSGANQDTRVVISNKMLKFHANDRREQFKNRWIDVLSTELRVSNSESRVPSIESRH